MKKSLLIIFLLLIVAPIGTISWLSYSSFVQERDSTSERYSILARRQLVEIDRLVTSHLSSLKRELLLYKDLDVTNISELRRIARRTGIVRQLFVIDKDDEFIFPPTTSEITSAEAQFLEEAGSLELPLVLGDRGGEATAVGSHNTGWYTWFMGDGINFIFWQLNEEGYRIGVVLDRIALVAGVVGALPDSDYTATSEYLSRIVLTDARGGVIYQWGLYAPLEGESPVVTVALTPPLSAWHLHFYLDTDTGGPFSLLRQYVSLFAGVAALVLVMVLFAVYFYRENKKLITDALNKVSFVNQVSHELRTPLTNIRLYSEMLEGRLTEKKDLEYVSVIMSEGRRLSRMIANVLTFSRSEKKGFDIHPTDTLVDDLIDRVLESFEPSLKKHSMKPLFLPGAPEPVITDPDLLEQIVSNLVGNAVKYAASGEVVEIVSRQDGTDTSIVVKDLGPGIPQKERKNIFKPFYRISNRLTEGVSGAGIGLAISLNLAKRLGGDLKLLTSDRGSAFKLTVRNYTEEKAP